MDNGTPAADANAGRSGPPTSRRALRIPEVVEAEEAADGHAAGVGCHPEGCRPRAGRSGTLRPELQAGMKLLPGLVPSSFRSRS